MPRERCAQWLGDWGVSLETLTAQVRPLAPTETLLLVGSIPDGLANALSDIDLLLIGDQPLRGGLVVNETDYQESVGQLANGKEIHVESWRRADVYALAGRLASLAALMQDPTGVESVERFSDSERRLLHRLHTGVVLAGESAAAEIRRRVPFAAFPAYLVLYFLNEHYTLREDAIAQVREGDAVSALWMLRQAMELMAGAVLASLGETNSYPKWRPRLLERHRPELGDAVVERLLDLLFPRREVPALDLARGAIAFADELLAAIAARQPQLVPAMRELDNRIPFVRSLGA